MCLCTPNGAIELTILLIASINSNLDFKTWNILDSVMRLIAVLFKVKGSIPNPEMRSSQMRNVLIPR